MVDVFSDSGLLSGWGLLGSRSLLGGGFSGSDCNGRSGQ